MRIVVKIIMYILFISVIVKFNNSINNHDWIWIVMGLFSVPYLGYVCGFDEDVDKIRNYILKK